jgi:hypothetical protein
MTIRCPVCRAENDLAPSCRRCKADLSPLVELEERRLNLLRLTADAAARGDAEAVIRHAREAHLLRPDQDALRWFAVGYLLKHNFPRALECHWLATVAAG